MTRSSNASVRALGFALAAGLSVGCAPGSTAGDPVRAVAAQATGTAGSAAPQRAVDVADRLVRAEAAYDAGDREQLAAILTALATAPPRPLEAEEQTRLEEWARTARVDLPPMRGRVLGPGFMRGTLRSGEVWAHEQNFFAGEPASLAVSNRGSGPLALRVSNGRQSPVCSFRANDRKVCRFTPIYTQRYRIELVNEGAEDAVYYVVID